MKILSVTFQNLNSISGDPVSIDFETGPLAEAGIFAITGPTGAGKTTILDAITLGLFGKAARYDTHMRAVPENMMSRGTGVCFSEVRFQASGGTYCARWDLRRARNKADGRVQSPKRQLADEAGEILESRLKDVDERVTTLTGLDYPRFLRSVLLAQGRFREFLDSGEKERGDLLERITGTEIYSHLSRLSHEAAAEREKEIADARTLVEGTVLLSEDETKSLQEEADALSLSVVETGTRLDSITQKLELFSAFTQAEKTEKTLSREAEHLKQEHRDLEPVRKRLQLDEKAVPLHGPFMLWDATRKELAELGKDEAATASRQNLSEKAAGTALSQVIQSCLAQENALQVRMKEEGRKRAELEAALARFACWQKENVRDEHLDAALPILRNEVMDTRKAQDDWIRISREVVEAETGRQRVQDERKQAEAGLEKACVNLRDAESAWKSALEQLAAHPKPDVLAKKKAVLEERQRLSSELKQADTDYEQVKREIDALGKSLEEKKAACAFHEQERGSLTKEIASAREIHSLKEALHEKSLLILSLTEHRERLKEGDACPLCGAMEHPFAEGLPSPTTESEKEKAKKAVTELEIAERKLGKTLSELAVSMEGISSRLTSKEEEAEKLQVRMASLLLQLKLDRSPDWAVFDADLASEMEALLGEIRNVEALESETRKLETIRVQASGEVAKSEQAQELLKKQQQDLEGKCRALVERREALNEVLAGKLDQATKSLSEWGASLDEPGPERLQPSLESLETRNRLWKTKAEARLKTDHELTKVVSGLDSLAAQKAAIEEEAEYWIEAARPFSDVADADSGDISFLTDTARRKAHAEKALTRHAEITARLTSLKEQMESKAESETGQQASLLSAMEAAGFGSVEALKAAWLMESEREALRKRLSDFETRKTRNQTLVEENRLSLETIALKNPPKEEEVPLLETKKRETEGERDALLTKSGELKQRLDSDQQTRNRLKTEISRIESLEKDARPWLLLKDLIGSSDGSKFSRFAQGLTLGQLVGLANHHLETLNPRYRIQRVPASDLELEIVDVYQANAVRPTRSLSGGESFLVSLALALGLSEMAGQKTRIESLFIDEGFGSLDADSLDIALAALENLRLSNRTIGIISHVELLKSRIGAQVEVRRNANGAATVRVS